MTVRHFVRALPEAQTITFKQLRELVAEAMRANVSDEALVTANLFPPLPAPGDLRELMVEDPNG